VLAVVGAGVGAGVANGVGIGVGLALGASAQLQGPFALQGHCPAGRRSQTASHLSSVAPRDMPFTRTAVHLDEGLGVAAAVVVIVVDGGRKVVVLGAVVGLGATPPPLAVIETSMQFRNSSPQPHLSQLPPGQLPPRPQLSALNPAA